MYQIIQEIHIVLNAIFKNFELIESEFKVLITFQDGTYFVFDTVNSFVVYTSVGILTFTVKPFALILQKLQYLRGFFGFCKLFVTAIDFFSPSVSKWLKFVLSFISLNDEFVLIEHSWFNSKETFKILRGKWVKSITLILDCCVFFFFSFLDLELLLLDFLRLSFCRFIFSWFRSICFLLRNLGLFKPLFNQITIFKSNKSVFWILNFEWNSKSFLFGSLWFCYIVADVLVESIYTGLVLDQDLNSFFSCEFDCLAWWYLSTCFIDEFGLLFGIKRWI